MGLPEKMPPKRRRPVAELAEAIQEPVNPAVLETGLRVRENTDVEKLNKLERDWLEVLRFRDYDWLEPQCMTFKLGDDCRYTPDFMALHEGRLIAFECKGFMRDDALVKLKTFARRYPWIEVKLVRRVQGKWVETKVKC
jgi:hypothetical protein